jgi:hypothetical protein
MFVISHQVVHLRPPSKRVYCVYVSEIFVLCLCVAGDGAQALKDGRQTLYH